MSIYVFGMFFYRSLPTAELCLRHTLPTPKGHNYFQLRSRVNDKILLSNRLFFSAETDLSLRVDKMSRKPIHLTQ